MSARAALLALLLMPAAAWAQEPQRGDRNRMSCETPRAALESQVPGPRSQVEDIACKALAEDRGLWTEDRNRDRASGIMKIVDQEDPLERPPRPRRPRSQAPSVESGERPLFIDFSQAEIEPVVGVALFSDDFRADPHLFVGVAMRAPMPWLWNDPEAEWQPFGAFAQLTVSGIDREVEPDLENASGVIAFLGAGADWVLYRDERAFLAVQAGVQYGWFNGVSGLEDGVALLVGGDAGLLVSEGVHVVLNPQFAYADAGDWIAFVSVGALIRF